MNELDGLEKRIRFSDAKLAGTISIGTYESFAIRLWPKFIRGFSQKYPYVQISLVSGSYKQLRRKLFEGQIDIAITAQIEDFPTLCFETLYMDSFGFYCSTSRKEIPRQISQNTFEQIKHLPLITVPSSDCYKFSLDRLLWENKIQPSLIYTLDTFEAARELALEGVGIAVIPRAIVKNATSKQRIKELIFSDHKGAIGKHQIGILFQKDAVDDVLIQTVVSELKTNFQ
ncbi:MAG: substrate-binding domain-containing protein [Bdellovibrionota bacterium]